MAHHGTVMRIKCRLTLIGSLALSQTHSTDRKKTSDLPVALECDGHMFAQSSSKIFFERASSFRTFFMESIPDGTGETNIPSHRGCEVTQLSSLFMSSLLLLTTDLILEFTFSAPLSMSSLPDLHHRQSSPCCNWVSLYFWPTLSGLEKKNNRRLLVDDHPSEGAENWVDVNQKPIYNQ